LLSWFQSFFAEWTPANWISFATAVLSLFVAALNTRSANNRERLKNRREEFHRRVATPIEVALDDFRSAIDDLDDLRSVKPIELTHIEPIEKKIKGAQRKLSRALRVAAASGLCTSESWDLGSDEYDRCILAMEMLRASEPPARPSMIPHAIEPLEALEKLVRDQIHTELRKYT
jgi:hypothetical protein